MELYDHIRTYDENCLVYGVGNVFIAGSSVFPTSGYANPNATIVALALRLADHLKRSVKKCAPSCEGGDRGGSEIF